MVERRYTDEEVAAIRRRAVERQSGEGLLDRDDLVEAAREVGIDSRAVHDAILEFDGDRDLEREIALLRRHRRRQLASNFGTWAIVNGGLLGLCFATGGEWLQACAWTAGPWAVALLLRGKSALFPNPAKERAKGVAALEERRARERRERAAQRKAERRDKGEGRGVDEILERGVSELLSAAARRMGARVEEPDLDEQEEEQAGRRRTRR